MPGNHREDCLDVAHPAENRYFFNNKSLCFHNRDLAVSYWHWICYANNLPLKIYINYQRRNKSKIFIMAKKYGVQLGP